MSVEEAKARLEPQQGEGMVGYITKADHQASYDDLAEGWASDIADAVGGVAADVVALDSRVDVVESTMATDAEVAAAVAPRVTGPASATDNALARFDGTTGKVVQNSGITVDDSGNVTSDLTLSKSAPTLTVTGAAAVMSMTSTSGEGQINASRPAGSIGGLLLRTSGSKRWFIYATSAPEEGSNAGSDLAIARYSDAGAYTSDALVISRANGKLTVGAVGATAGLELGSSGPRVMSGTGSPQGVVTAPVGSTWIDTSATTGAVQWIKASGTGNTGWKVQYGDTGWRDLSAGLENSWALVTGNTLRVRRIGATVHLHTSAMSPTSATATTFYSLPSGFGAYGTNSTFISVVGNDSLDPVRLTITTGRALQLPLPPTTGNYISMSVSWATDDAWPTSLPGSAA